MASNLLEFTDSSWTRGINSMTDPTALGQGYVQYSVNTLCRGASYQTRPGRVRQKRPSTNYARGITVFKPVDKDPYLVAAFGGRIYALAYPFTGGWTQITNIWATDITDTPIVFETAMKGAKTNDDGSLTVLDKPYPVLMMQSGIGRALAWDGKTVTELDPSDNQTPIGTWMKWISNRLWVATGNKIRVSNILDPLTFTEEDIAAEGGFFTLPDDCTGLGATVDQKSLLAFTNTTTTAFQAGIRQRNTWKDTTDFQKLLFDNIGCVAGNTIVSQYGILWWLSQGGLIRLDTAIRSYITSKIHYLDNNMSRSKGNLSPDLSRACAGWYENFLMLSVPSGDQYNAHTWVMDQGTSDLLTEEAAPLWASVWTGTKPAQWVTANIKGQSRCFCISYDEGYEGLNRRFESNIWENFVRVKKDIGADIAGVQAIKEIESSVEFKYLGYSEIYKKYKYVTLEVSQLSGLVHVDVFYASRHSGYRQILSKDIVATTNSMTVGVPLNGVDTYIKQDRSLKPYDDEPQPMDLTSQAENILTGNSDKAFSVLVKWTGEMTINKVKLCCTPDNDHVEVEEDETTQRYVKPDGSGLTTTLAPVASSLNHGRTGSNLLPVAPRWEEDIYTSLT